MSNPIDGILDAIEDPDYDPATLASFHLETAAQSLNHITTNVTEQGTKYTIREAIEHAKVTALIGIGHALTALANNNDTGRENNDDDDTLARHVLDETLS